MTAVELARVRGRLVAFAEEMLAPIGRSERRRWGECYLRGLMLDGKRKSIEPMAARLADGDEQGLQTCSAWPCIRGRCTRAACRRGRRAVYHARETIDPSASSSTPSASLMLGEGLQAASRGAVRAPLRLPRALTPLAPREPTLRRVSRPTHSQVRVGP